jgi:hypothetical protein
VGVVAVPPQRAVAGCGDVIRLPATVHEHVKIM